MFHTCIQVSFNSTWSDFTVYLNVLWLNYKLQGVNG